MSVTRTRTRILDAVLACVAVEGLTGLTVEDVAGHAGVSRQTVYRHFTNRSSLVEAAILREERAFIEGMLQASATAHSLGEAVQAAASRALELARDHPILNHLLEKEPESLLPYLAVGRGPVIAAAGLAVQDLVRRYRPHLDQRHLRLVADMSSRLLVSYIVSRDETLSDDALADAMAIVVVALASGEA